MPKKNHAVHLLGLVDLGLLLRRVLAELNIQNALIMVQYTHRQYCLWNTVRLNRNNFCQIQ